MSQSMNKVFLIGHLGHRPELRTTKEGKPYARLRLATSRYMGPGVEESTDWHSVFVFGDAAERCGQYLSKGARVFVQGNLRYWESQDEKNKYQQAINADKVDFITYSGRSEAENVDNSGTPRNHNDVAHL